MQHASRSNGLGAGVHLTGSFPEEPIAIVGVGLRLPGGAVDLDSFWEVLAGGQSAVGPVPTDRWDADAFYHPDPEVRGRSYTRRAAFLDQIDGFDHAFFGISPREARHLDPQHRLVLEAAWHALEDAGVSPSSLIASPTGVFVGIGPSDYRHLQRDQEDAEAHALTGTDSSFAAGRVAFNLGLQGPALAVDTAASSSLVALHLACQSLRRRECTFALAAGVNALASPHAFVTLSRTRTLAPDGQCKTFSAAADGYGRGEGVVVLALERLDDARLRGRPILALVRGSAVNNGGAASGITVPNGLAQQKVLRAALADARLTPADIDVVECHGTGTVVGDPIEVEALAAVYGTDRPTQRPLLLGSVKTNIGHLEAGAGLAGVAKILAAFRRGALPPTLHTRPRNPAIDWSRAPLEVVEDLRPWPAPGDSGRRRAGVSAFGLSGTNAHVVLEEPPANVGRRQAPARSGPHLPAIPFLVSARGEAALAAQAEILRQHLDDHPELGLADLGHTLFRARAHLEHRALVVAGERPALLEALQALALGEPAPGLVRGQNDLRGKLAFVFPGQGSQWAGMARQLFATSPVFRRRLEECAQALEPHLDWSLLDLLTGRAAGPPLERVDVVQPALFAVMVSLAALWRSLGAEPDAVIGHSQGEIAAACVAGALTVADAAKVVALRSHALARLAGRGAMASVELSGAELVDRLRPFGERLAVAAHNSPRSALVSGDPQAVDALLDRLAAERIFARKVRVDYASHGAHIDAVEPELLPALADLAPRAAAVPLYSTVTGQRIDGRALDAAYWYRNLRQPVRFAETAHELLADGSRFFIEVSPHPVATVALQENAAAAGRPVAVVGSLRREQGDLAAILLSWAELFSRGCELDGSKVVPAGRLVSLPLYPFRRERAWLEPPAGPATPTAPSAARASDSEAAGPVTLAERLATVEEGERERRLRDLVRAEAATVLRLRPGQVDSERPLKEVGLDSLLAVELRNRLAGAAGRPLSRTLLFDHPTVSALARFLRAEMFGGGEDVAGTAPAPVAAEPIAIIGMGCRFPGGATSPEALWQILRDGSDVIAAVPHDRGWGLDDRAGGFLHAIDRFDADFFGISPREAVAMDPQQRLLLETSWEALERAEIAPDSLRDSASGVFIGLLGADYQQLAAERLGADAHAFLGNTMSVASGRIAYTLGLQGPAMTVDTACSSSLVAVHLACQSLRQGECVLALAGGATVLATSAMLSALARLTNVSSPDGRCRSFSAEANGAGWSEGVGMLVLERLSDARRNGHPVLATILGSAVNQDGRSQGLTAPNGPAQQRVLRQALASAGLAPGLVDAVEAHGTGTTLGDPIEAQALLAVYGQGRSAERPLWLGSIKSNLGHSNAAAGVAGVIKMVLALQHGLLPRTLHAETPSPHVDWSAGTAHLLQAPRAWPAEGAGHRRRAGVSSFGISGTNAHLILEEAPAPPAEAAAPAAPPSLAVWPFLVSAASEPALRAQAEGLRAHLLAHPDLALADLAAALATARAHLARRAGIVAGTRDGLLHALQAVASGEGPAPGLVRPRAAAGGKLAVLFTGQGSQRAGMGRELYQALPGFRAALEQACDAFAGHLDRPLLDLLLAAEGSAQADLLEQTGYAQPALFALELALFQLCQGWGLRPELLSGHSIGEIVAAHLAGVFDLPDAAALVAARGRLMQALPPGGGMLAVQASEAELRPLLEARQHQLDIASVNGPSATVVSGAQQALAELAAHLAELGRKSTRLRVSHGFHSPLIDPMLEPFRRALDRLAFAPPRLPVVSNLTGQLATADQLTSPDYWVRHARQPVRFADGVRTLLAHGATTLLELGPHAVLSPMAEESLPGTKTRCVPTLRRNRPEVAALLDALATLHTAGHALDWSAFFAPFARRRVPLPTYAFQRERFWIDAPDGAAPASPRQTVDGWRYQVGWQRLPDPPAADPSGRWLLLTPPAGRELARGLAGALTERGAALHTLTIAADETRGSLAERLRGPLAEGAPPRGVLSLLALDETAHPEQPDLPAGLALTLALTQALADLGASAPLWLLTRGAVSTGPSDRLTQPLQAAVWALGRVAALEHPDRWGGLLDLDGPPDSAAGARLVAVLAGGGLEDQIAVRGGALFGRRLRRALGPDPTRPPMRPRGTVLITGGTGELGAHVARWLAGRGPEHLVLAGRRGAGAPGAAELSAELTARGTRVTLVACDVADREALTALLAALDGSDPPLRAVVHLAGLGQQSPLADLALSDLARVFAAKAAGARHLHELLRGRELDAFVLFSSVSGVWGAGQQGAYAAANGFLDALAERRRGEGLPATAIAWGAWTGQAMGGGSAAQEQLRRRGIRPMAPDLAAQALADALDGDETTLTVADVDWARFAPALAAARPRPLLADLADAQQALAPEPPTDTAPEPPLLARLRALSPPERAPQLLALVLAETTAVLGHRDPTRLDPDNGFFDLGLDSLMAVDLRRRITAATGIRTPATVAFDHPSPSALASWLAEQIEGQAQAAVLEDLTRLESALFALPTGGPLQRDVARRLRTLLARWTRARPSAPVPLPPAEGADDEQLFALVEGIEQELAADEAT